MKTARERIFWGALLVCILCAVYVFLSINGLAYKDLMTSTPKAHITLIPAASIPTMDLALVTLATPTSTLDPQLQTSSITTGMYVQISGTGDTGLRIRNNPGTSSETKFVANESEVFMVIGGPVGLDEYTWWQLSAPYDESRQGWAAQNYLQSINP